MAQSQKHWIPYLAIAGVIVACRVGVIGISSLSQPPEAEPRASVRVAEDPVASILFADSLSTQLQVDLWGDQQHGLPETFNNWPFWRIPESDQRIENLESLSGAELHQILVDSEPTPERALGFYHWLTPKQQKQLVHQIMSFPDHYGRILLWALLQSDQYADDVNLSLFNYPRQGEIHLLVIAAEPTSEQILAFYDTLQLKFKSILLTNAVEHPHPVSDRLMDQILVDPERPERFWLAANLWWRGDLRGEDLVLEIVNGNFRPLIDIPFKERLKNLSDFRSYESESFSLHDYNDIHVSLVKKYPESPLAQACQEFEMIRESIERRRGNLDLDQEYSYFDNYIWDYRCVDDRDDYVPQSLSLAEEETRWKQWLETYRDHPGADDAAYWLGRNLESQGKRLEVLKRYADLLIDPIGDGDMLWRLSDRFLIALDMHTTFEELQEFLESYPDHPLSPIIQYEVALRYARQHQYRKALEITQSLDIPKILEPYPHLTSYWNYWENSYLYLSLEEQQQRWSMLSRWEARSTPEEIYRIAASWAASDGWENGYLLLFSHSRSGILNGYFIEPNEVVRNNLRQANHHAVALELLVELLQDPNTPSDLVQRSRYWQSTTLINQLRYYPRFETETIYPLAHVSGEGDPDPLPSLPNCNLESWDCKKEYWQSLPNIKRWYRDQAFFAVDKLLQQFPSSNYGDDSLIGLYYNYGGNPCYLKRLLAQFPNGDRADEARKLLSSYSEKHEQMPECGGIKAQLGWQLPVLMEPLIPILAPHVSNHE